MTPLKVKQAISYQTDKYAIAITERVKNDHVSILMNGLASGSGLIKSNGTIVKAQNSNSVSAFQIDCISQNYTSTYVLTSTGSSVSITPSLSMTQPSSSSTPRYNAILSPDGAYLACIAEGMNSKIYRISDGSTYRSFTPTSGTSRKLICVFTPSKLIIGYEYISSTSIKLYYVNYTSSSTISESTITVSGAISFSGYTGHANYPIFGAVSTNIICLPMYGTNILYVINTSSMTLVTTLTLQAKINGYFDTKFIPYTSGGFCFLSHHGTSTNGIWSSVYRLTSSSASLTQNLPIGSSSNTTYSVGIVSHGAISVSNRWLQNSTYYGTIRTIYSNGTVILPSIFTNSFNYDGANNQMTIVKSDDNHCWIGIVSATYGSAQYMGLFTIMEYTSDNAVGRVLFVPGDSFIVKDGYLYGRVINIGPTKTVSGGYIKEVPLYRIKV